MSDWAEPKPKTFELTEDHVKLLRAMYVDWEDSEFGAPCIDPKRPYGNSDVENDIAEELGWEVFEDHDGEKHLSSEQYELAQRLHRETQTALQIVLSTGSFEPGNYVQRRRYGKDWDKV
jgi:hypothetical protein